MKDNVGCGTILIVFFLIVVLAFALSCIQAGIALWLWGAILVPTFGAPVLSFWETFGLVWLIHIFVGGSRVVSSACDSVRNKD